MVHDAIDIREFAEDDLEAVVLFSLRAWEPVFASVQAVLGDEIFLRLHPDWRTSQEDTVRSICMDPERNVYVAVAGARPVGFVAVALNAFHERMGVIEIIGVDPDYQRRGVRTRLTEFATDDMRRRGMDIAVVETGGDPGHAPARALYGDVGFTSLPPPSAGTRLARTRRRAPSRRARTASGCVNRAAGSNGRPTRRARS